MATHYSRLESILPLDPLDQPLPSSTLPPVQEGTRRRVAMFLSIDSFEGFYGGTFGLDRETFLTTYRNDFVWEYAGGLSRCGHPVFLYILSFGPPTVHQTPEGIQVRFLPLPLWFRFLDPILFRLRSMRYGPSLRDRIAYLGYGRALHRALQADAIDILYHQELWTPRFDIVIEHRSVPVMGAEHGAVYAPWMESAKRRSLPLAAQVICQSLTNLERARAFGAKAELMYNGVDTGFFSPPESPTTRPRMLLAVGRLVEDQKRFSDLLRALLLLPEYTLTLVGSGPDQARLKALAAELKISDRVHFAGFVADRQELRRLYRECGVFVSTSSWEAVALVLLEAMSCGAPVVATAIPSFQELLADGQDGILVPVGAPERLAEAIRQAFAQQQELGLHARAKVESGYSSGALYKRLSDLIQASA